MSYGTLVPGPSAKAGRNTADIRKTDVRAFKFIYGMKPLEKTKELIRIFHVSPYDIVFH
jgi:hypothetical protein